MTYLSLTQFETRHRLLQTELERDHARAADRRVVARPPRRRRARHWLSAVRGAAATQ